MGEVHSAHDGITTRMYEFFLQDTPWHRRLWTVGTPLLLHEVAEYAQGVAAGAMRPEGLTYICTTAAAQVERDTQLDTPHARDGLLALLRRQASLTDKAAISGPLLKAQTQAELYERTRSAETGYLRRWSARVESTPVPQDDVELVARLVAAHLLDIGFSPEHLRGWMKSKLEEGASVAELIQSASDMARKDSVVYEVWVPYESIPDAVIEEAGDRFMGWEYFVDYLSSKSAPPPKSTARKGVGFLRFDVTAREPKAALEAAEVEMRRLRSRCIVGQVGEVGLSSTSGWAIAVNASTPRWKQLPRHGKIHVPSLTSHGGLFPKSAADATMDDALELLASVEASTSWASLASIWAALEGLLIADPRESGVLAADRAADIVACSLPAAELRTLQHKAPLQKGLTAAEFLREIDPATLTDFKPEDEAALNRLRRFHDDPSTLIRARSYFRDAFRRLYNQRNLLMHAARFDSVALPAAMRTMPPLVGAAMDRIVNSRAGGGSNNAVALAARAELSLSHLGKLGCRDVGYLLS